MSLDPHLHLISRQLQRRSRGRRMLCPMHHQTCLSVHRLCRMRHGLNQDVAQQTYKRIHTEQALHALLQIVQR